MQGRLKGLEPKNWISLSRMSILFERLMWLKLRSFQNSIQVNQREQKQHRAGFGVASIMGISLWSENSAKVTLFCALKAPKMLPTALFAGASRETTITIYLRYIGWVKILISIFGRYLRWAKILITIFGRFGP